MFYPDEIDEKALNENSIEIAKMIMEIQNENPFPETGTLGFIIGLSIALGNIVALYADGTSQSERQEFMDVFTDILFDYYKHPFIKGTLNDSPTAH